MAGLIAVGVALGAEKLGRTISEKRLERKEKKAIAQHEAIYGTSSSSSGPPLPMTTRGQQERTQEKRDDAQRPLHEARRGQCAEPQDERRRRSVSVDRASEDDPPPSYNEAVRQGAA